MRRTSRSLSPNPDGTKPLRGGSGDRSVDAAACAALATEYMGWRLMREEVPEAAYAKQTLPFTDTGQQQWRTATYGAWD